MTASAEHQVINDTLLSAYQLPETEKAAAYETLKKEYDTDLIVEAMVRCNGSYGYDYKEAAEKIDVGLLFPPSKKEIKTVGLYYHRICNGGIERVMAQMSKFFCRGGMNVVVITDEEPGENDYDIDEKAVRVVLNEQVHVTDKDELTGRYAKFRDCIKKYDIDCVIYHAWMTPQVFWDIAFIKSTGAYAVVHSHGHFSCGLVYRVSLVIGDELKHRYADGMVCLSVSDRVFWSEYVKKVFKIHNPVTIAGSGSGPSELKSHNIVWTGRPDDPYKQANYMPEILKRVMEVYPDATVTICGQMTDEILAWFKEEEKRLGIEGHIEYTGFTKNVPYYLNRASVFMQTSRIEGYSLSIIEALYTGLPVVSFELPFLMLFNESNAVVQVPQKDAGAAADAIIKLFSDEKYREELGSRGRAYAEKIADIDCFALWKEIFDALTDPDYQTVISTDDYREYIRVSDYVMRQSLGEYNQSWNTIQDLLHTNEELRKEQSERNKVIDNLQQEIKGIYSSKTFRLGSTMTALPKKILRRQ